MAALDSILPLIPVAQAIVGAHLNRTESRNLGWLAPYTGRDVTAKLETQQVTSSFKVRGALFALSQLEPGSYVVAPSAGNHGLAVAWAAARLGMTANIVLPQNASPLKRERILRLGAGIIETGSTVDEASAEARRIAQRSQWHYLSPFNDAAVVAGQATAFIELLEDCPDIQSLVIPVGGGGLLAGAVAAREYLRRQVRLLACEPENFPSLAESVRAGHLLRLPRRPTFADGLCTNVEENSITLEIALAAADLSFCLVSEEEIAAACMAVFNREAILAEGAAGAAVAATLRAAEAGLPDGVIGTVLSGGNVHHSTFWQMAAFPLTAPRLVALADTYGRSVDNEPLRRQRSTPLEDAHPPYATTFDDDIDIDEAGLPGDLMASIDEYTVKTRAMLEDIATLAQDEGLPLEGSLLRLVGDVNELVRSRLSLPYGGLQAREQSFRVLSQLAAAARLAFEWRSPGYAQSAALAAFDPGSLDSPSVNYARYDQPGVVDIERSLGELLGVSPERHAVLVTSSGMAAFALASATAFSARPAHHALTAPYLYFEAMEMLHYWFPGQVVSATSYQAEKIAAEASTLGADVVFADPLTNHPEQRMIDIERLAEFLAADAREPWLIVDGSMLPTITASPVTRALPERAIYYESCSKYLQFGLDMAMAGMVVVPRSIEALARRVRRNLGLGLDRYGAELFPKYRPVQFKRRISAMEESALRVAEGIYRALPEDVCEVIFPGMESHADHKLALRLGGSGSCVTLIPAGIQLGRDQLDPCVDIAIFEARKRAVPLVKGVSFGFSVSRISTASAMAETAPPFLRLAIGPLSTGSAAELADVLSLAITQAAAAWHG